MTCTIDTRLRRAVTLLLAPLLALALVAARSATPIRTSRLTVGFNWSGTLRATSQPATSAQLRRLLTGSGLAQDQALMGFGVGNPEPSPGVYDWSGLDERLGLARATGATSVLTLCGAPDWMKGGAEGTTDYSRLDVAPTPDHFADFAALAAAAVRRYPQVAVVQVWNELKGFYDTADNRWDYAAYTQLYNDVYDAVKAVRPSVAVAGPYISMDAWTAPDHTSDPSPLRGPWGVVDQRSLDVVTYWLAHKHGADLLTVDTAGVDRDGNATTAFGQLAKITAITSWLRARTTLPLWYAEIYPALGVRGHNGDPEHDALVVQALVDAAWTGVSRVLLWDPEVDGAPTSGYLWSSTTTKVTPTHLLRVVEQVLPLLRPGTRLARSTVGHGVTVLTTPRGSIAVSSSAARQTVRVAGRTLHLSPYAVQVVTPR